MKAFDHLSPHVLAHETACKCGCGFGAREADVDPILLDRFEALRSLAGDHPLIINCGCRCQKHNAAVGGAPNSQHTHGRAFDLAHGSPVWLASLAEEAGFNGIITYDWGVHVDVRPLEVYHDDRRTHRHEHTATL